MDEEGNGTIKKRIIEASRVHNQDDMQTNEMWRAPHNEPLMVNDTHLLVELSGVGEYPGSKCTSANCYH